MAVCETCGARDVSTPCPPWTLVRNQQCEGCGAGLGSKFRRGRSLRYCGECWDTLLMEIDRKLGLVPEPSSAMHG